MFSEARRPSSLPDKRLLVFVCPSTPYIAYLDALKTRRVEAVMASYYYISQGNQWRRIRAVLDTWSQYRYLDSGAFTVLRSSGPSPTLADVQSFFEGYVSFLKTHLNEFDYVFDLDLDPLTVQGVPGVELTLKHRRVLREAAGAKLIPVWHRAAGLSAWKELATEFPYIAIGFDRRKPDGPEFRYLVDLAHRAGVLVHALGVSCLDAGGIRYDSADSTAWIATKYAKFAGTQVTPRKLSYNPAEFQARVKLKANVLALGYDPTVLTSDSVREKVEIAIALFQSRQP